MPGRYIIATNSKHPMGRAVSETAQAAGLPLHPDPDIDLKATWFLDYSEDTVRDFADRVAGAAASPVEKAVRLFYAVRDEILYDPYSMRLDPASYRASHCLEARRGYCVYKAGLMTAASRAVGIPARIGFADVRNHLCTRRLREMMGGTDVFYYHGYSALWLNERWVKVTPVFNIGLCDRFNVAPQEFDGTRDALFHPFDRENRRHMEYIRDHGTFDDLPFDLVAAEMRRCYPMIAEIEEGAAGGDFAAEARAEN